MAYKPVMVEVDGNDIYGMDHVVETMKEYFGETMKSVEFDERNEVFHVVDSVGRKGTIILDGGINYEDGDHDDVDWDQATNFPSFVWAHRDGELVIVVG